MALCIFEHAEGNADSLDPVCSTAGRTVKCEFLYRSRVGPNGRSLANNIFPGVGVPYNWRKITYSLSCDGTYVIDYSASYFPSHRAYLRGQGRTTRDQSGLPDFMFAGDGKDAPGGSFYSASGSPFYSVAGSGSSN